MYARHARVPFLEQMESDMAVFLLGFLLYYHTKLDSRKPLGFVVY